MLDILTRWFKAPPFPDDEDKTRSALLLNSVINTFLVALLVIIGGVLLGDQVPRFERTIIILAAAWLMILGIRLIMLSGRVALAGKMMTILVFLATTLSIYNNGTVRAPAASYYMLTIVMSGLIIGHRALIWTACSSTIVILTFLVAERNGWLPPANLAISSTQGVTFVVSYAVISILLYLAMDSIDQALKRARRELAVREKTEGALKHSNSQLEIMHEIDRALLISEDVHQVTLNALVNIRQLIPCPRASITLFDHERKEACFLIAHQEGKINIPATPISFEEFGQRVIDELLQNKPWFSDDVLLDPRRTELDKRLADEKGIRVWLSLPLITQGQLIGALNLGRFAGSPFTREDALIAHDVANQLAVALHQSNLHNALQNELTERKRLITELEKSNDELTRFTYTVSHDLRNPLVTIKGFLGMLIKDLDENRREKVQNDIQRIASATDKMNELLSGLLELSRIGRIVNPPVGIDTVRLIEDAIDSVDARLRSNHVTVNIQPNLPTLYGDRIRLREVFENLIDNAAKYMGNQSAPVIEIGAKGQEGECIFSIRDNGMGIDPAYQTRIFSLFEKLNPIAEGTGIGLTLVKRIIETHGGKIWVESEGEGQGTTFYFMVPGNNGIQPGEIKSA